MILYNPRSWFGLIFEFHRSDTFRKMIWVLLAFAGYTTALTYVELRYSAYFAFLDTVVVHSLLGFIMGLLLVFRTNTGYDRWWEGRKQWGALVNSTRHLAYQLAALLPGEEYAEDRAALTRLIASYPSALRHHLRRMAPDEILRRIAEDTPHGLRPGDIATDDPQHIPNTIAAELYRRIVAWNRAGVISGEMLINLNAELARFTDITGACERILKTPIPYGYSLFIKKFIFAYTLTLPLGLVNEFSWWTVPLATFVLYVFGSLELLAEEVEEPFGEDANDLPTDPLADTMRGNIAELLA
jgi:ion channel-forming bestrophin family protein